MNILFLISNLSYGGAEKQVVVDANMLAAEHNVFVITFYDGAQKKLLNKRISYLNLEKKGYFKTAKKIASFIKSNKIDIIHSYLFLACIISALASLFIQTKLVWHFHSHEYDAPLFSRISFILFSRLKSVKKIFFASKELMDYSQKRFFFQKSKLEVLYNTPSLDCEVNLNNKNKSDKKIIGYVGRLVALKRVHYLVECAQYLLEHGFTNFEIWIIGDGEERGNLTSVITNLGVNSYIKLFGFQTNTLFFYQKFDVFALPSEEECLSIALLDASMCGIPAVAFNVGGNSEIIINNKTGFIVESKIDFFERIMLLLKDEKKRGEFSVEAKKFCITNFNFENRKKKLLEL